MCYSKIVKLRPLLNQLSVLIELTLQKNKLYDIDGRSHDANEIAGALTSMLQTSYAAIGGYSGGGALGDFSGFFVADVDEDPDPDLALYYKRKAGTKIAALATDGGSEAKREVIDFLVKLLDKTGTWIEVSEALANVLLKKRGIKSLDNEKQVRRALDGKELVWHGKNPEGLTYGTGWYSRKIDGQERTKVIVGRPAA